MKTAAITVGSTVKVLPSARGWNPYAHMTGTVTEVTQDGYALVALAEAAGSTLYTSLASLAEA